jgi:hypothetical protein
MHGRPNEPDRNETFEHAALVEQVTDTSGVVMQRLLKLAVAGSGFLPFAATAQISVGANVHVSRMRDSLVHDEVLMDADPRDPSRLIGCSIAHVPGRRSLVTVLYASNDGGKSWRPTVTDTTEMAGDPVCVFGEGGKAYFISISYGSGATANTMKVFRSSDYGETWAAPITLARVPDRPAMIVDRTGGKYNGRVYIAYNGAGEVLGIDAKTKKTGLALVYSTDGGATFSSPVMRAILSGDSDSGWPLDAEILSDGTLVIFYKQCVTAICSRSQLKVLMSRDGGETIEPAIVAADMNHPDGNNNVTNSAVDASNGPFRDRLYATWHDARAGRYQIYSVYSVDKGKTWSKPRVVNDDREWPVGDDGKRGPNHDKPQIVVNKDGVVGIMWADRRDSPGDNGYNIRMSASLDGGDTWLPSVRVSSKPMAAAIDEPWAFDPSSSPGDSTSRRPISVSVRRSEWDAGGHTFGHAARSDGVFVPLWVDDRTGRHQLWAAPVSVTGGVVMNGSAELATMADVSGRVTLDLTYVTHDRGKGLLTVSARLKNLSADTVRGPFKVRVLSLSSPAGEISIDNADNRLSGEGAVWDFSSTTPNGWILPKASAAERKLTFRLTGLRTKRSKVRTLADISVMDMDVRVLAPKK